MTAGWQTKLLGNVLIKTETVNPASAPDAAFRYIDVSSVCNDTFAIASTQRLLGREAPSRARRLVRTNDVLFATIRPTLKRIAVVPDELDSQVCSTGYFVMRPGAEIDHRFLFHYLFSTPFMDAMASLQKGASYPAVTDAEIRAQPISYPALSEQQRIVAILDEAFEAIATAKANAEKNLQNARDLFAGHLQAVFSRRSHGWVSKAVRQWVNEGVLAKPQDGNHGEIHPTKADYVDVGVPFIMAADMIDGMVDTEGCRFIAKELASALRIGFAKAGDVLLSHKGTIGRVAVLDTYADYVILTPQVTYYRSLDNNRLFNSFLYYCLLSPEFQTTMARIAGAGSTRAYIGITRQLDLEIAIPPIDVQRETAAQLKRIDDSSSKLTEIYEAKLAALDELKKSLLHQAFTGQL